MYRETQKYHSEDAVSERLTRESFSDHGIQTTLNAARTDGIGVIDNGKINGFTSVTVEYDSGLWLIEIESGYLGPEGHIT